MSIFIKVEFDADRCTPDGGARLAELCPVNVFTWQDGRLGTDADNEDECTLCELCLKAYPAGAITLRRLYRE